MQHGDTHVIAQIESTCKKLKHDSLTTIAAACSCCHCSSLTDTWRRQEEDDNSLPYNTGDACHPTEIKLYCRSREFDGLSKTALFQLSRACTKYPESTIRGLSDFGRL